MVKEYSRYLEQVQIILELRVTKEAGMKTKCKDLESISMLVEPLTKANGKIINIMEKEFMNSQMEPFMKGNGSIIKCTEQASI
jgi:hypothetical protein